MGYRPNLRNKPAIQQKKVEFDGYKFDSKAEMARYQHLKVLQHVGEVNELEIHPRIPLEVNGSKVCEYRPDFRYKDRYGKLVIEDVKGTWKNQAAFKRTTNWQVFRLKAKLLKAITGTEVSVIYG